jgi:photosystem II stability/assembly factor-like uncharacterized protein
MISSDGGYSWKKLANGLDYDDQLTSLAVSPAFVEDRTVFVSSGGDGVYRSEDGGKSWEKMNSGLTDQNILSVHVSPRYASSQMVMVINAKGELFNSHDKGKNWYHSPGPGSEVKCLIFLSDVENEMILAGTVNGQLYLSEDAGISWREVWRHPDCGVITCLSAPRFSNENKTVLAGTEKCGVLMVELANGHFQQMSTGLKDKAITSIWAETSNNELLLYVSSDEGFFRFNGKEGKWENLSKGLTTDIQAKEPAFLSPNFKGISASGDLIFLGGFDGLFRSSDGGRNWRQLDTVSLGIITGLCVSPAKGKGSHKVALATYGGGAYLYNNSEQRWTVINKGLSWTRLNDMVFSPNFAEDGLIFSGSERNFLVFEAKNAEWQRIPVSRGFYSRVIDKLKRSLKKLGMSASNRDMLLGYKRSDSRFPTSVVPSPAIDKDGTVYFGTRGNGIYWSKNRGRTNSMLWDAEKGLVTSLAISPLYKIDGTLFAGIFGVGIFKSTDKGYSWERIGSDITAKGEIFLSISPKYENDKTIVMGNGSGLFLSSDGGSNWRRIGADVMKGPITCVSISPDYADDGIVIVGVMGSGLWISSDKGGNFHRFSTQLIRNNYQAKYFEFSRKFSMDSTMYCSTSYELFRSADRGQTWEIIYRPLRFEDFREEIRYEGKWNLEKDEEYSALTETFSNVEGSRARLIFVGSGIRWIGSKSNLHGNADIFIDGELTGRVSQKVDGPTKKKGGVVFEKTGLERRSHEIVIEVVCPDKQQPCGWVSVDALESDPGDSIAVAIQSN